MAPSQTLAPSQTSIPEDCMRQGREPTLLKRPGVLQTCSLSGGNLASSCLHKYPAHPASHSPRKDPPLASPEKAVITTHLKQIDLILTIVWYEVLAIWTNFGTRRVFLKCKACKSFRAFGERYSSVVPLTKKVFVYAHGSINLSHCFVFFCFIEL